MRATDPNARIPESIPETAPPGPAAATGTVADLADLLRGRRTLVLTGAGCSTESGIPDYRGPGTRARARNPIQHHEFVTRPEARTRYWARSMLGWPRFSVARPNAGHRALAEMERAGACVGLLTQNVDGLHQAAGSARVVELHGALARVRCLSCGTFESRHALQDRLARDNPGFDADVLMAGAVEVRPDGDAELPASVLEGFRVPECQLCAGVLKPDVVFFGGSVPREVVDEAFAMLDGAEALLVVGSSLAVYSGFRFVRRASEKGIPVAMVNLGPARGQELARVRVEARAGEVLPALATALGA